MAISEAEAELYLQIKTIITPNLSNEFEILIECPLPRPIKQTRETEMENIKALLSDSYSLADKSNR